MTMDNETLEAVATLAQLIITPESKPALEQKISKIFVLVEKMDELDVSDIHPLTHPLDIEQPLRPDVVVLSESREQIEHCVNYTTQHFYASPQVLHKNAEES